MRTALESQVYTFDQKIYRHLKGGLIGDNISQIAARLVMRLFTTGFIDKLRRHQLIHLTEVIKLYVDDLNQVGYSLPYGTWYKDGKMYVHGKGWTGRSYNESGMTKQELTEIQTEAERLNRTPRRRGTETLQESTE